jgi:hypothetical protein
LTLACTSKYEGSASPTWYTATASPLFESAATCSVPPLTCQVPLSAAGLRACAIVEVGRAQHVALAAGDVAGLRVGRRAGLALPGEILLAHHPSSPSGSPLRNAIGRIAGVGARVGSAPSLAPACTGTPPAAAAACG